MSENIKEKNDIVLAINPLGELAIKRYSSLVTQQCPWTIRGVRTRSCGDWCPLFSEPRYMNIGTYNGKIKYRVILEICRKTFNVDGKEFKDERKGYER